MRESQGMGFELGNIELFVFLSLKGIIQTLWVGEK
jgi:hypothetical protein